MYISDYVDAFIDTCKAKPCFDGALAGKLYRLFQVIEKKGLLEETLKDLIEFEKLVKAIEAKHE
jgi:hypothetical protein